MNNYNGMGFPNNDENDRTTAFSISKKQRRNDSVSWLVWSIILFFLTVVSLGRITIIGQFIDDIVFTLPFGWFKYFLYLLTFLVNISIYAGIKFKPKKRFIAMVFVTWAMLCWFISSILFIVAFNLNTENFKIEKIWSDSILKDSINSYLTNWHDHSLFGTENSFLIASPESYFTVWAGGGFIGTLLAGLFSYTSIYGSLIFCLFFMFINAMWIFTGDPFYLFKSKDKRKGKRLRILSLKNKHYKSNEVKKEKTKGLFNIFSSLNEDTFDEREILASIKESDITIELPSYNRPRNDYNVYQQPDNDFYNSNFEIDFNNFNESPINNGYINKNDAGFNDVYPSEPKPQNKQSYYNRDLKENHEISREFISKQSKGFYEDVTMPIQSRYGESSVEKAREEFEKESKVTPFGANGKTTELITGRKTNKKNESLEGQITLEQFINEVNKEKEEQQRYLEDYNDYTSPLQNHFDHSFNNNKNYRNTQVESISKPKSFEKEMYVNLNYSLPIIDILNPNENSLKQQEELKQQAQRKAEAINNIFAQFNVNAKVSDMNIGPSVTKFEVQPAPGTKVNSITTLENDLKLALANQNVRIEAPIQGKAAVGIEVPNDTSLVVPLRSVLEKSPIQKLNAKLFFAIGKTVSGDLLFGELDKMPHLLVAGSTGSGKSVMINNIISSILMRAKPNEVKFLMIDPKKVELSIYSSIPHLLAPVISDMHLANNALKKVINEMERRYQLFNQFGAKNIDGYNQKQKDVNKKLPYFVIIIDELADLMMTANKRDVEDSIMRLTQMARAAGIHLIVATQRPSTDVLTGVIKSNIPTRIGFAVASSIDSRTILDSSGAEKLIGKGDLLYMPPGSSTLIRAQGSFISDEEIERLVQHCSMQQQQLFDEEFLNVENEIDHGSMNASQRDPMFEEIKNWVIQSQKASTSSIQRRFSIGYNRAARIIDELEESGIIGPQNGAKPREVYLKPEDIY